MAENSSTMEGRRPEEGVRAIIRLIVSELIPDQPGKKAESDMLLVEDLGYHSLALMELAFTLEDEFNLPTIDEQTARKIQRVIDVENHVIDILRARGEVVDVHNESKVLATNQTTSEISGELG